MKVEIKTPYVVLSLLVCFNLAAQTAKQLPLKTIVATYDSALAYQEISWLYFTDAKDGKVVKFQPPDQNGNLKLLRQFWRNAPSKVDNNAGIEWHTAEGHQGTKYELTYVTKKIEGSGGMMDVNVIKEYETYDSLYLKFKVDYQTWKAENGKLEAQNKATNPGLIAKKYLELGKKGDLNGMKQLIISKDMIKGIDDHSIYKHIDRLDKIAKENTPEATKNEIAKLFLRDFNGDRFKVLTNPVVYYNSPSDVCVAVAEGGKAMFYITLTKVNGQWKISRADDRADVVPQYGIPKYNLERIIQKRVKELNPE